MSGRTAHARAYLFEGGTDQTEVRKAFIACNPESFVQVARAGAVKNEFLAEMLAAQTFSAQASGSLLAKKAEMDLLLRLAGTTQISRAIKSLGAVSGEAFLAINAARSSVAVPPGLEGSELPRRPLTESELARVEKAALLNVQRS